MKKTKEVPRVFVGVREAAGMLSIDAATVYRLVESGELPAYRVTQHRIVISLQEFEKFMQDRRTVSNDCGL